MLNPRSEKNLQGVHDDLVRVVRAAAVALPQAHPGLGFVVTEGLRTRERQARLLAAGASQTMNSRHLTGHAVDIAVTVNGEVRWDWPLYGKAAAVFKRVATDLAVPITWGGDWTRLRDGPHFELNRVRYPA